MRQVPKYLVIGSGRMARHFCHYLQLLKLPFQNWSRKNNSLEELVKFSESCSQVLILISDSSIEDFYTEYAFLHTKICVHFSGCLVLANVASAHPLMTFGQELYELDTYQSVPFILEDGGSVFAELLPGLSNRNFKIPKELKPLYHALGVMATNFTTLLWQKVSQKMQDTLQLPPEIIQPLLQQTLTNFIANPKKALTGPLVRGDQKVIDMHLEALKNDPYKEIYQAFVRSYQ